MEPLIRLENVCKTYGSGKAKVQALEDVSFTVNEGEFVVLLGSSGAGKTTLLNLLGGMDTVTSGKILFDGKEVSSMSKKDLVSYRRYDVSASCSSSTI